MLDCNIVPRYIGCLSVRRIECCEGVAAVAGSTVQQRADPLAKEDFEALARAQRQNLTKREPQ